MDVVEPSVDLVISVGCVGSEQHPGLIWAIESSRCKRPEPGVDSDDKCAGSHVSPDKTCLVASVRLTFPFSINIGGEAVVTRTSSLLRRIGCWWLGSRVSRATSSAFDIYAFALPVDTLRILMRTCEQFGLQGPPTLLQGSLPSHFTRSERLEVYQ